MRKMLSGITSWEEAKMALQLDMDALGFVLEPKSARYVNPETAREIIQQLPPFICTVGVFQDTPRYVIQELTTFCRLDWLLFLGQESPDACEDYFQPIIKYLPSMVRHHEYSNVKAFLLEKQEPSFIQEGKDQIYTIVPGTSVNDRIDNVYGLYYLLQADGSFSKQPIRDLRHF